jgi:hypothetical protein
VPGKPLKRFLALVTCGLANIASLSDATNVDDSGLYYHAPPVAVAISPVDSSGLALEIKIGQHGARLRDQRLGVSARHSCGARGQMVRCLGRCLNFQLKIFQSASGIWE